LDRGLAPGELDHPSFEAGDSAGHLAEPAAPLPGGTPWTVRAKPVDMPDFSAPTEGQRLAPTIDLLQDVNLRVKIELGRTRMLIEDVLKLGVGSVVELDKLAGDPVDVIANDRLIARGEVLVLNDNFCVRVSEVVSSGEDGSDAD